MLRGRHRGLPVAIDRAVMLPELKLDNEMNLQRRGANVEMNQTFVERVPDGVGGTSPKPAPNVQTTSIREVV
jgi:hypothetical protein